MGAYEDAAEARIAAAKAANEAADAAEKARVAASGKANAASKPLTRAQRVTAERLATSPIAKEAARTTAALKSFTAKGGLLGVPGSNLQGSTGSTFTSTDGILYANGKPFTGNNNGTDYFNGKPVKFTDLKGTGTEDDPFTLNGEVFTGLLGGRSFQNGRLTNASGQTTGTTGQTYTAPDGKIFTDLASYNAYIEQTKQEDKRVQGQSAYDLLFTQFQQYGMGALVEPLKQFIQQGLSSSEFTLRLRETDAYKKRFAANASRIAKGLSALNEAEYIGLEDQYQNIMREYGLPASYYARGEMGRQEGFEKFLANDVSAAELEDRVLTAQSRVTNANPEVLAALKQFYPGIANGDILAYTLDPEKALTDIKRKVTAAEIGGAAMQRGLGTNMSRAEELGAAGVTKQQAQQGYGTIAGGLQRGSQLAAIYGESPYTQTTAESEIFNIAGSTEAEKQRKKITGLEKATFSGQSGISSGALVRDRAGAY